MVQEQFFDGSLIYVLNLAAPLDHPDGVERGIIAELHGDFLATDTETCDAVLTEDQHSLTVEHGAHLCDRRRRSREHNPWNRARSSPSSTPGSAAD